jgi:hypothetical protein
MENSQVEVTFVPHLLCIPHIMRERAFDDKGCHFLFGIKVAKKPVNTMNNIYYQFNDSLMVVVTLSTKMSLV